ncbi:XkdQ/YqbQ family protein [Paenibacillus kandeliae]|uniref:XkdQ/YqbQ family protein n=1 Tax=Paenibacillus kandeliae TaxID=3231269 RepID=UPI00345ACF33
MADFAVVYGKHSARHVLSDAITDLSWSSSRDEITRSMTVRLRSVPTLKIAGMLMCFAKRTNVGVTHHKNQFWHGPVIKYNVDDKTDECELEVREISWYLTKNKGTRPYLKGEAGAELQRYIKSTGIDFRCPAFGFKLDERYSTMSYSEVILDVLQKAYERSGYKFYLDVVRTDTGFYLQVVREGKNTTVPIFVPDQMESSSRGFSMEETYTVVTAEKWKDDKLVSSVTRTNKEAVKTLGRMQEIIEVEEDEKPETIAAERLKALSAPVQTRSITVRHNDHKLSQLRAGWIVITRETGHYSKWIVSSEQTSYKNGQYIVQLELERREVK